MSVVVDLVLNCTPAAHQTHLIYIYIYIYIVSLERSLGRVRGFPPKKQIVSKRPTANCKMRFKAVEASYGYRGDKARKTNRTI